MRGPTAAVTLFAGLVSLSLGCDSPRVQTCGQIPGDGCPIGRGGTCDDPYCAGLYDCAEGSWVEVTACDQNPVTSSSGTGGSGTGGEGGCSPFLFDHSKEASGCVPDLQEPDCPVAAAETCPAPCLTGCVDFFMCFSEGWQAVGFCDERAQLVVTQGGAP